MRLFYELGYRFCRMPWETGPREELVGLVDSGRIAPCRAIDLGCGTGSNSIFLAQRGFEVTGVDLVPRRSPGPGEEQAPLGQTCDSWSTTSRTCRPWKALLTSWWTMARWTTCAQRTATCTCVTSCRSPTRTAATCCGALSGPPAGGRGWSWLWRSSRGRLSGALAVFSRSSASPARPILRDGRARSRLT
ncbi:MAG: methyltransferase domain-containing protein [Anaerolineae bacterium]|nr:methyltransferase domain-containing protein [Anaerolineae bacterium]